MGQQQLLLIVLGTIVVGIAVAVGISQFAASGVQANKDGVTAGLIALAANAYEYKIRPATMGGGSNSYVSYTIPSMMRSDDHGTYRLGEIPTATRIVFTCSSSMNAAWVATMTVDSTGKTSFSYNGW